MKRTAIAVWILVGLTLTAPSGFAQDLDSSETGLVNHRETTGVGFTLGIGPFASFRRMTLSGSLRDIDHLPGIYIGGIIDAGISIGTIKNYGTLRLVGRGGFASAKSSDQSGFLGRQAVTENTFMNVHLVLTRPLNSVFDIIFIAGGGATAFTVEPNPRYTGHRYVTLDIGAKAHYWFTRRGFVGGGMIVRPSLFTNQSDDADGPGRGFGINPTIDFGFRIIEPNKNDLASAVEMVLAYDLNYFNSAFPLSGRVGSDPTASDQSHMLSLALRYNL